MIPQQGATHPPVSAPVVQSAPSSLPAGSWVVAYAPASWWIHTENDGGGPSIWEPRPGKTPRFICSEGLAGPELWAVLARALPDRGTCEACTALPCPDHGGEA